MFILHVVYVVRLTVVQQLVGALGTLLILHLCSKLPSVSCLNQLFDGVGLEF